MLLLGKSKVPSEKLSESHTDFHAHVDKADSEFKRINQAYEILFDRENKSR